MICEVNGAFDDLPVIPVWELNLFVFCATDAEFTRAFLAMLPALSKGSCGEQPMPITEELKNVRRFESAGFTHEQTEFF